MPDTVLDEQARDVLRTLRVGGRFTIKGTPGTFQVKEWHHPTESEPWVSAHKCEGPWGLTMSRAIRVSRIEAVVPMKST